MSLSCVYSFAAAPSVTRGVPCSFGSGANGNVFAHGSGSVVYIRDANDPNTILRIAQFHPAPVTAVRVSPDGRQCASGDEKGNLRIWSCDPKSTSAKEYQPLSAPIRDVAWTQDGERIVVVGEGRSTRGVVLNASMGTTMGELGAVPGDLSSADFKKDRPFRVAVGSNDATVGVFEGPPFKFLRSIPDKHKNRVNCVRYSPDNEVIASVSGGRDILLQDGRTGEVQRTIPTEHTGTIYALAWSPDGAEIATASADKTVRSYRVADGTQAFSHVCGSTVDHMQLGIMHTVAGWASTSVAGAITFFARDGTVTRTVHGFSKAVKSLIPAANDAVFAADFDGHCVLLRRSADGLVPEGSRPSYVEGMCSIGANVWLFGGEKLGTVDLAAMTSSVSTVDRATCGCCLGTGELVLGVGKSIVVMKGGSIVVKHSVPKKPIRLAAAQATVAVCFEDGAHVLRFDGKALQPVSEYDAAANTQQTLHAIAISDDGTLCATGDRDGIVVWDSAKATAVHTGLGHHMSLVGTMAFAPGSTTSLASGANSGSLIVWDLPNQSRIKVENAHIGPVSTLAFAADGKTIFTGGHDGVVKMWATE